MTNTSHANCTHPATKAARAKCRRERAQGEIHVSAAALAEYDSLIALIDEVNAMETARGIDPFDLFPEPEDDWADADRYFGTGDDSGSGYADLLDR